MDEAIAQAYLQGDNECPSCGEAGKVDGGSLDYEHTAIYQRCWCTECGSEWTSSYHLSAIITDSEIIDIEIEKLIKEKPPQ